MTNIREAPKMTFVTPSLRTIAQSASTDLARLVNGDFVVEISFVFAAASTGYARAEKEAR